MIPNSDRYYRELAERHPEGFYHTVMAKYGAAPIGGAFGPAFSDANPGGYRAYVTMSRFSPRSDGYTITDLYGRQRWLNGIGWKVMCLALLNIASGTQISLTALSERVGCHRQTVSRWITKLTAWGIVGSVTLRGRYGGLFLFARTAIDNLERYAQKARAKLARVRARILNAHPLPQTAEVSTNLLVSKGAHLDYGDPEARRQRIMDGLNIDNSRRSGMLRCPAHEDKRSSLSFKILPEGKLLLHCFAGCTYQEIVGSVL